MSTTILAGVHGIEPCSQGFGGPWITSFPHPCSILAPSAGLEPATRALTVRCSTN